MAKHWPMQFAKWLLFRRPVPGLDHGQSLADMKSLVFHDQPTREDAAGGGRQIDRDTSGNHFQERIAKRNGRAAFHKPNARSNEALPQAEIGKHEMLLSGHDYTRCTMSRAW